MKKIIKPLITIILVIFSFYYTNKSIEIVRNIDPIMKSIKASSTKYKKKSVNAKVEGNTIIPGISGKQIDYQKSYSKMKQYGSYNEVLTTFKEQKPTISIDDYYNKYIVSGNKKSKNIALVFKIKSTDNPIPLTNKLLELNVTSTFFIDGLFIENNSNYIESLTNFEIELLSYDQKYDEIYFNSAINYLESLTRNETKYCYTEKENDKLLSLCEKLKLHTISPTIRVIDRPYQKIKNSLVNSAIISLEINSSTNQELTSIINYIKSKGYNLVTLKDLLNENQEK